MSFFSHLVLAANHGFRAPAAGELDTIFAPAGLLRPPGQSPAHYNLHADITALFDDPAARQVNDRFFCPDAIDSAPAFASEC